MKILPSQHYSFKIALALATVMIILFLLIGRYALPYADDYTFAASSQHYSIFTSMYNQYMNWDGRYTANFLSALFGLISSSNYWIMPIIAILGTYIALVFLINALFPNYKRNDCLALATIIFGFYLIISPIIYNVRHALRIYYEQFFWAPGIITYQIGIIFSLLFLGAILHFNRRPLIKYLVLAILTCILAIGCNEMMMVAIDAIIMLFLILFFNSQSRLFWITLLLVAAIASAVVILSPGNAIRGANFHQQHFLLHSLTMAITNCFLATLIYLVNPIFWLFMLLLAPQYHELNQRLNHYITHPLLKTLLFLGFITLLFLPAAWAMGSSPPARGHALISLTILLLLPLCLSALFEHYKHLKIITNLEKFTTRQYIKKIYLIVILFSLAFCSITAPAIPNAIQTLVYSNKFQRQVTLCQLNSKQTSTHHCRNPQNYYALYLLGWPSNIQDDNNFG